MKKGTLNLFIDKGSSCPSYVEIHEHKAPTDETIKLLDEMKKKAFESIIGQLVLESNVLKGVVSAISLDYIGRNGYRILFQFILNDIPYKLDIDIDYNKLFLQTPEDILKYILKEASTVIAEKMLVEAVTNNFEFKKLIMNKE